MKEEENINIEETNPVIDTPVAPGFDNALNGPTLPVGDHDGPITDSTIETDPEVPDGQSDDTDPGNEPSGEDQESPEEPEEKETVEPETIEWLKESISKRNKDYDELMEAIDKIAYGEKVPRGTEPSPCKIVFDVYTLNAIKRGGAISITVEGDELKAPGFMVRDKTVTY